MAYISQGKMILSNQEMARLDGVPTFLCVCQITTDFSAYHNNEADEIHAAFFAGHHFPLI